MNNNKLTAFKTSLPDFIQHDSKISICLMMFTVSKIFYIIFPYIWFLLLYFIFFSIFRINEISNMLRKQSEMLEVLAQKSKLKEG